MNRNVFATALVLITSAAGAAGLGIEAAIEQRQEIFKAMKDDVKELKEAMSDGGDAVRAPAERIVNHSRELVGMFIDGSHEGKTRAKKKIWENRDDFDRRQQELIADAEAVLAANETGDRAALKTAFKNLSKDCKGCHQRYRQIF